MSFSKSPLSGFPTCRITLFINVFVTLFVVFFPTPTLLSPSIQWRAAVLVLGKVWDSFSVHVTAQHNGEVNECQLFTENKTESSPLCKGEVRNSYF